MDGDLRDADLLESAGEVGADEAGVVPAEADFGGCWDAAFGGFIDRADDLLGDADGVFGVAEEF